MSNELERACKETVVKMRGILNDMPVHHIIGLYCNETQSKNVNLSYLRAVINTFTKKYDSLTFKP